MAIRYALTRLLLYSPIAQTYKKGHLESGGCDTMTLIDLTWYDVFSQGDSICGK